MKLVILLFSCLFLTSCQRVVASSIQGESSNMTRIGYKEYKESVEICLEERYRESYSDASPELTAVIGFDGLAIDLYRLDKIDGLKKNLDLCFDKELKNENYRFIYYDSIGIEQILSKKDALNKLHVELAPEQYELIAKYSNEVNNKKIVKKKFRNIKQCKEHAKAMIEDKIENKAYTPNIRKYYNDCLKEF